MLQAAKRLFVHQKEFIKRPNLVIFKSRQYSIYGSDWPPIKSAIITNQQLFQDNLKENTKMLDQLAQIRADQGASLEKYRKRHLERGRLTVQGRLSLLLDPGSAFLELSELAGYHLYGEGEEDVVGGGIRVGIGSVCGRVCMIIANDPLVKAGTYYPITVKKHVRAQEIAGSLRLPCIYLVDSGGANLPHQSNVFPDARHFGRIFLNEARMSADGVAQIAAVLGPCTAGGAYLPAMADESVIVQGNGTLFLAGPPLVKEATGEIVDAQELGGAQVHCFKSGVCDHMAKDDAEAMRKVRLIVSTLSSPSKSPKTERNAEISKNTNPNYNSIPHSAMTSRDKDNNDLLPLYPAHEFAGIISVSSLKKAVDPLEIIARIVDKSQFLHFKKDYGPTLVCGWAHLDGQMIGIIANNGVIMGEAAEKGSHFIQLCDHRTIPLLFLQNITGFMVGKDAEHGGIAKKGALLVRAVACAKVPKCTLIVGASYGAGNYGMCGRAYEGEFLFVWPGSKIGVMGGEQAAGVLASIKEAKRQKSIRTAPPDHSSGANQTTRNSTHKHHDEFNKLKEKFEHESSALYSTARLWDDGIVAPENTRQTLILAFKACANKLERLRKSKAGDFGDKGGNYYGVFRM